MCEATWPLRPSPAGSTNGLKRSAAETAHISNTRFNVRLPSKRHEKSAMAAIVPGVLLSYVRSQTHCLL
jgi:hypothetical protein